MEAAIAKVFPDIIHRICRWHVVNKLSSPLNELYVTHEKRNFKGKFNSVLNHPLTPGLCSLPKFLSPNFTILLSHQIFYLMHGALNVDK